MKKFDTLCVGLEHFIDKIGYQAYIYQTHGERIKYLVSDVSGNSKEFSLKYNADVEIVPKSIVGRMYNYIKNLISCKNSYIELYLTGKLSLFYAIIGKLFRKKIIVILRGLEFDGSRFIKKLNILTLKIADKIIAKEINLINSCRENKFENKTEFLHNCVPIIKDTTIKNYKDRDIDIIFLNTPRHGRNVLFLIDVLYKILQINPNLKITLAGFSVLNKMTSPIEADYQYEVLKHIENLRLSENLQIMGFVDNSRELLMKSKIFILPANTIFCNYTLLEAMSMGCVPVVANGEGAHLIVDDKENGEICGLSISEFSDSINRCLNESVWKKYSTQAKDKIDKKFSIEAWYGRLKKIKNSI